MKLQSGDVLVLETGPEFTKVFAHNPAFALISTVPNSAPVKRNRMWIALFIVAALIGTQVGGLLAPPPAPQAGGAGPLGAWTGGPGVVLRAAAAV